MTHYYANMVFFGEKTVLYAAKSLKDADFRRRMFTEGGFKVYSVVGTEPFKPEEVIE